MSETFEPERLYCVAGECLEEAVLVGHATLEADVRAGAAEDERRVKFSLPLCRHHAHLLRLNNTLVEFDSGARSQPEC